MIATSGAKRKPTARDSLKSTGTESQRIKRPARHACKHSAPLRTSGGGGNHAVAGPQTGCRGAPRHLHRWQAHHNQPSVLRLDAVGDDAAQQPAAAARFRVLSAHNQDASLPAPGPATKIAREGRWHGQGHDRSLATHPALRQVLQVMALHLRLEVLAGGRRKDRATQLSRGFAQSAARREEPAAKGHHSRCGPWPLEPCVEEVPLPHSCIVHLNGVQQHVVPVHILAAADGSHVLPPDATTRRPERRTPRGLAASHASACGSYISQLRSVSMHCSSAGVPISSEQPPAAKTMPPTQRSRDPIAHEEAAQCPSTAHADGVVDVARAEQAAQGALEVVAADHSEPSVRQLDRCCAHAALGHRGALGPTAALCVQHLHRIERFLPLRASAKDVQHAWRHVPEVKERRYTPAPDLLGQWRP
eukprot:CAMPEP_0175373442 /NCGR_PEP_ID=MMETSP0095-20121207/22739_1 /TAXON_ID=311494 /ORGANISM="Alexandrium monilatum, Strain CCMP3105" /LENGTH=417 /DNA_ID=CAMNT_0016671649 /DNA_START=112 /DNA_END=1368 /DNA_ORIENTATION=+